MTFKLFYKRVLYSSWFIALIPVFITVFFYPLTLSRYSLSVTKGESSHKLAYSDLNNDSVSEKVLLFESSPFNFVVVQNASGRIYDQWNLTDSLIDKLVNGSSPVFLVTMITTGTRKFMSLPIQVIHFFLTSMNFLTLGTKERNGSLLTG
jgi:hypothetical protein